MKMALSLQEPWERQLDQALARPGLSGQKLAVDLAEQTDLTRGIRALVFILERERLRQRRRERVAGRIGLFLLGVLAALVATYGLAEEANALLAALVALAAGAPLILGVWGCLRQPTRRWENTVGAALGIASRVRTPALVGMLLEVAAEFDLASHWVGEPRRFQLLQALTWLLNRMDPGDVARLSLHHRTYLQRALTTPIGPSVLNFPTDFQIAALLTLALIGDTGIAADAKRLYNRHPDPRMREAAAHCLRRLGVPLGGP